MSLIFQSKDCSLIDHRDFMSNLFQNVVCEQVLSSFAITSKLFSIRSTKKEFARKRGHNSNEILEETATIKQLFGKLLQEIPNEIKENLQRMYDLLDTATVRKMSKALFESTVFDHLGASGGNNSDVPLQCMVRDELFLIPPKSRFFCGFIKEQCKKLQGDKFDIVIADPPWWNKYIRRLKRASEKLSYTMMYNEDIASIPVQGLLSDNCLVAVWCTNSPSNITAVKQLIFPAWGVEYLATWYWLKVTVELEPLCDFGTGCKKQPYERLILGKVGELKVTPETKLFASVPSALHSHKPPLLDLLTPIVKAEHPQTLELFARYLLPNTTSVGLEPLKWQHISLYETVS